MVSRSWLRSQVLNNFLVEYNTMAKRGMELVLFMAAAQHVSQAAPGKLIRRASSLHF